MSRNKPGNPLFGLRQFTAAFVWAKFTSPLARRDRSPARQRSFRGKVIPSFVDLPHPGPLEACEAIRYVPGGFVGQALGEEGARAGARKERRPDIQGDGRPSSAPTAD
jgi:hypothetical protein